MDNFYLQVQEIERVLNNQGVKQLKKEFNKISLKYREEKGGEAIVKNESEVLTYVSSRMSETTAVINDVVNKICKVSNFQQNIKTVLDVGSGTGACLWALDNHIKNLKVVAIEREPMMIKYAKLLSEKLSCKIDYIKNNVLSQDVKKLERFDLVIESFMLNELSDEDRLKAVDFMCEKSADFLVIIEPGTPTSYERMMLVREYVLSKGFNIIIPCMHSGKCGLKNDYCNFSVRVNRTRNNMHIKGGTLNYEDEKYFYLVFRKNDKREESYNVILRKPFHRKGCVDLKLCKEDGGIENKTITKSNKTFYKQAKDFKHGDIVKFD